MATLTIHHPVLRETCEACHALSDFGMMLSEISFTNSKRAFVERLGLVVFSLNSRRLGGGDSKAHHITC